MMQQLLNKLESLGFYKYTEPRLVKKAKAESLESGYLYVEGTNRDFMADSEDLAEGGVKEFLESIRPFLERQGVSIEEVEEDFSVSGVYSVSVNGEEFTMYTEEELETEEIWELTTRRALSIVNTLLKRAGSNERLYFLYGGNDTRAVFLTPEMYEAISRSPAIDGYEKPNAVG